MRLVRVRPCRSENVERADLPGLDGALYNRSGVIRRMQTGCSQGKFAALLILALVCLPFAFGQSTTAQMTNPTPGSTLTGSSATFSWTTGTGVTAYWLYLGTAAGASNLYNSGSLSATSVTVNNLPTNGVTLYATLFSQVSGAWVPVSFTYTEAGSYTLAALSSPTPGSVLPGSSVPFSWTSGTGPTAYWLYLGTTVGASNLYSSGSLSGTSVTVNNLPTNGVAIYATLFSQIDGAWKPASFTYTEAGSYTLAALSSPSPGGVLPGPSVAFSWTLGAGPTAYWLYLGTTAGASNLFNSGSLSGTSVTVNNLPTNGVTLYATLFSQINGAWKPVGYTYTEAGSYTLAAMTSPSPGSVLFNSTATFTWSAGAGPTAYWLFLGTTVGASNLYSSGSLSGNSVTVNNLPTNGATIYATLFSMIDGGWKPVPYTYTEASPPSQATITTPTPGSVLPGSSQTFSWTAGSQVAAYWLYLGTTGTGSSNIYNSGSISGTSIAVSGLPTNGVTLYATLFSQIGGAWKPASFTYTEAGSYALAALTSPSPGSVLSGSSIPFSWTSGTGPTAYWLYLGTTAGASNLYNSGSLSGTSVTVNNLPTNSEAIYATLFSNIDGGWKPEVYTYTASGPLVSALSCVNSSMTGAGNDSCTVTLGSAAGSGGVNVGLGSNNAAVTVPVSVTVPANATSVMFSATVSAVTTTQTVTLKATTGSVSQTFSLQLNPAVSTVAPVLIHSNGSEDARSANESGNATINMPLAEPTIAGNCAGVAFRYGTGNNPTPSLSDPQGDTYYQVPENPVDSANGIKMEVWIAPNVAAGVPYVTINFGAQTGNMQFITFEVANCGSTSSAITDGHTSNVSTGTAVTAGSMTPGNSGDLVLHFAFIDANANAPALTSASLFSQPNITWALRHAELLDGELMQYGVYNSTSAFAPEITVAPSSTAISIAIAIQGTSGGGLPSGVTVNSIQHVQLCLGGYCQNNAPSSPQPSITQFPMTGNALFAVINGGCDISSIEYGSTLMTKRITYTGTGASETEQIFDLLNNTPNNTSQLAITFDNTGCTGQQGYAYSYTVLLYDVTVNGTWSFGALGTSASGYASSCSSLCTLDGASVTPAATSGIAFATMSGWFNEVNGIGSPWFDDTIWPDIEYQYPNLDENNGWAHFENTGTSEETTTWDYLQPGVAPGYWASSAATYTATITGDDQVHGDSNLAAKRTKSGSTPDW